jgi:CheY-like chemotaxis protein
MTGTIPDRPARRRRSRVLIIDDCADDRRLIALALARHLPTVDFRMAPDGDVAIAAIQQDKPDLVILDLFMPRRSGLEVLRDMRRALPDAPPVLVVTSSQLDSLLEEARAAGADHVMLKPCIERGYAALAAAIGRYLDSEA